MMNSSGLRTQAALHRTLFHLSFFRYSELVRIEKYLLKVSFMYSLIFLCFVFVLFLVGVSAQVQTNTKETTFIAIRSDQSNQCLFTRVGAGAITLYTDIYVYVRYLFDVLYVSRRFQWRHIYIDKYVALSYNGDESVSTRGWVKIASKMTLAFPCSFTRPVSALSFTLMLLDDAKFTIVTVNFPIHPRVRRCQFLSVIIIAAS